MSLPALREQLSTLLAPPRAGRAAAMPTGIAALDRALSDGGIPAGRLTEILGARGSGRTTLVRHLVMTAVAARRWVAVIDGSRTLAPREWAEAGSSGRLWVIRPREAARSAWCADLVLRSGAFSLVVLDGAPSLPRPVAIRLTRLAREHDVALVVVGEGGIVGSAVRLRVRRAGSGQRAGGRSAESRITSHESRVTIHVEKGGVQHAVEVSCAIEMARRLRTHPEVPDRRGVARRDRWGRRVDEQRPTDGGPGRPSGAAPKQRRFGEAANTREQFLLGDKRQAPGAGRHGSGQRNRRATQRPRAIG